MNTPIRALRGCFALSSGILTVSIGILVAGNFALAKFLVREGLSSFSVFYWQLLAASVLLLAIIGMQGQKLSLRFRHIRYYVIGGILGVSTPQLVAYTVLKHIPAGLFTVLVTLSPLMTFLITSLIDRKFLPFHKLIGILIGLAGVSITTAIGFDTAKISAMWILPAFSVPILLGITNVYRSKALPADAHPLSLAAGTLLSQTLLLLPVLLLTEQNYVPLLSMGNADLAIISLASITALSYLLTFVLQRLTDGVSFSQVGYFVTLSGVFIGAVVFGEPLHFSLVSSVALLFLGLAITNGQLTFTKNFQRKS